MKKQTGKGQHLGLEERIEIYKLRDLGLSGRKIAKEIGRHHSVVNRELSRNSERFSGKYEAVKAHSKSKKRSKKQREKAPLKNPRVYLYVRDKLRKERWTPEQIAGRISVDIPGESISYETIYQYIYSLGRKDQLWRYLPRSHKRRKKKRQYKTDTSQHRLKHVVSIEERGAWVNNRGQVGHWETDLMESKRGIDEVVSAHIERKTRFVKLTKLRDKKAKSKQKEMQKTLKLVQSVSKSRRPIVKTVTYDNGSENAYHYKVAKKLKIKGYFCHPYHSWEKGSVENVIGRVRRFIPKGTDLSSISDTYLQKVENWINNAPLKCLDWKTPNEAMEQETNTYKFRKYRKVLNLSGAFPL